MADAAPAPGEDAARGDDARLMVDLVARRSHGKLVAILAVKNRDVAAAEDALSDAIAAALKAWPAQGCPSNPEAWLLTTARRKLIDAARRARTSDAAVAQIQMDSPGADAIIESEISDHRLALMFACAHPAIDASVRSPLILQVMLGLDAARIASAFLTSPAAMAKRLVRAKEKIRRAGIAFRVPETEELPERLAVVLDAIYAAFTDGWTDAAGADASRGELVEEAIFLAGVVTELLPDEAEALGLRALMLYAHARRAARRTARGEYVPLAEQDTALWDAPMIVEAESLLRRAGKLGAIGRYQLEAALQSAHAERCRTGRNSWPDVVRLYDLLQAVAPSPVVAINRAVAIGECGGARAGLAAMPSDDERMLVYQPYWAARAMLLAGAGERDEACRAYDLAIGLERDPAVRSYLLQARAAVA